MVRPHFTVPAQATRAIHPVLSNIEMSSNGQMTMAPHQPGAWIVSSKTITTTGHVFVMPTASPCLSGTEQQCNAWFASQHLRQLITYQPASRYWAFQWYETAIFLALALAPGGLCAWRIRRLS